MFPIRSVLVALVVVTSAGAESPVTPADLAVRVDGVFGSSRQLDDALSAVLRAVERRDFRELAKVCERLARVHTRLADQLGDAAHLAGQVRGRLALTTRHLGRLGSAASADANAGAELALLRHELLGRLQAARERYRQALDAGQAARCLDPKPHLAEVERLVNQLAQLDDWTAALRQGRGPLVSAEQVADLGRQLQGLTARLDDEEALLRSFAVSLAATLRYLPAELNRAVTLLETEQALPRADLERLQARRAALQQLAGELRQSREVLSRTQKAAVPGEKPISPERTAELLRRADGYLGQ